LLVENYFVFVLATQIFHALFEVKQVSHGLCITAHPPESRTDDTVYDCRNEINIAERMLFLRFRV
jgi:hypothetical protein